MPDTPTGKLAELLSSPDEANARLGLQFVRQRGLGPGVLEALFVLAKASEDKALVTEAKALLAEHGTDALKEAVKSRMSLAGRASEKKIRTNIKKFAADTELDGVLVAQALYRRNGTGAGYLLAESPPDRQVDVLRGFVRGDRLDLRDKGLSKMPPAMFELTELRHVDLRENKIAAIPKDIAKLDQLETLLLGNNLLKRVAKEFGRLQNLRTLDVSRNSLPDELPPHLFASPALEDLDVNYLRSDGYKARPLPDSFFQLKRLRRLRTNETGRLNKPLFTNFPHVGTIEGDPIVLDPARIGREHLRNGGDVRAALYFTNHGEPAERLDALRRLLNEDGGIDLYDYPLQEIPMELTQLGIRRLRLFHNDLGTPPDADLPEKERVAADLHATRALAQLPDLERLELWSHYLVTAAPLLASKGIKEVELHTRFKASELGLPAGCKVKQR